MAGYDLEERTFRFARAFRKCAENVKWKPVQWSDVNQLLRSSGSVAANYTEANNTVSKADFLYRIRLAKKEATESKLWLRLLIEITSESDLRDTLAKLPKESDELIPS